MIKDIYYWFYRLWNEWNPKHLLRRAKWFIQRGSRGYSDRDVWSIDWYISSWLPNALRQLRDNNNGIPSVMLDDMTKEPDEAAMEKADTKWKEVLTRMIVGFEEYHKDKECIGEYATYNKERDQNVYDMLHESLALFNEYFENLWD